MRAAPALALAALLGACSDPGPVDRGFPVDAAVVAADVAPAVNACGGATVLGHRVGEACGACGLFACDGAEALRCDGDGAPNACGACGPVPMEQCNERDDDCDGLVDEGCVRRIASTRFVSRVRLDGDWAVLEVSGAPAGAPTRSADVLLVRVSTGAVRALVAERIAGTGATTPAGAHGASIDGAHVAWVEDDRYGVPSRLVAFERATGRYQQHPVGLLPTATTALGGGRVLFAGTGVDGSTLRAWDLATDAVTPLTPAGPVEAAPEASGDWVVFERSTRTTPLPQVVARNLVTLDEVALSGGLPGANHAPAVGGTTVVWQREEGDRALTSEVYAFDLATRARRVLSTEPRAVAARVRDGLVCWSHRPDPSANDTRYTYDLSVMDLRTNRASVIGPRGSDCDVSGRRVSWVQIQTGDALWRDLLDGEP